MMNRMLLGATALMLAVPAVGQMQAPVAPMAQRMETTQTRDQAVAKVRDRFARMDVNRDGFVAGDEVRSLRGQRGALGERRGRGGNRMAQNGGRVANPGAAFDRLDANRDNMISREEFSRARELRGDRRAERKMHRMGGKGAGRMMRLADLDRDGRVSLQEATTSALQRFDRVDANRDGRITPEERRQQRQMRQQMRMNRAG